MSLWFFERHGTYYYQIYCFILVFSLTLVPIVYYIISFKCVLSWKQWLAEKLLCNSFLQWRINGAHAVSFMFFTNDSYIPNVVQLSQQCKNNFKVQAQIMNTFFFNLLLRWEKFISKKNCIDIVVGTRDEV